MGSGSRQGPVNPEPEPTGATEPITLTDPDGAVTRVAPWSSWTREQVRAPGGEPALVTRLDQGQLWFSAGRRRSPWRHEVHVGPAIVSTPRGRFQAIAEPDGGATINCLAGRTRVVAGLREPVLLGPDQSAAVSSDGRTLVVMDRATGAAVPEPDLIDLTDAAMLEAAELRALEAEAVAEIAAAAEAEMAEVAAVSRAEGSASALPPVSTTALPYWTDRPGSGSEPDDAPEADGRPARLGWIPELVAVVALAALLIAAVWVFTSSDDEPDVALPPGSTAPITEASNATTETTEPTTSSTSTAEATTSTTDAVTTTQTTPPSATGATGAGQLASCRRAEGGVLATVEVTHRSGPASRFRVTAALVDVNGQQFAQGQADSGVIAPGATAPVEVLVPVSGTVSGACELLAVTSL